MRGSAKMAKGSVEEAEGVQVCNLNLRARGPTDPATGGSADKANDGTQLAINRPRGECSVYQSNM
jgi:hypothetical protein